MEILKHTHTYKTIEDRPILADVYQKPNGIVKPVIFYLHGGALIMGSRSWLDQIQTEKYLDAGFTLISIDYRLAPQAKLSQIIDDLEDAYKWTRLNGPKEFSIDPNRIAVIGHSAGGYLALLAGFRLVPRPKAIVSFYGYGDIAGEWYSQPDPFYCQQPLVTRDEAVRSVGRQVVSEDSNGDREQFYLYTRQQGAWPLEVAGYDPAQETEAFDTLCPVRNVTKEYPPTLLLHGENDTDVPYDQSVQMARELGRCGVQHALINLPGYGHGFDGAMEDRIVAKAFDRVLQFLEVHLKKS